MRSLASLARSLPEFPWLRSPTVRLGSRRCRKANAAAPRRWITHSKCHLFTCHVRCDHACVCAARLSYGQQLLGLADASAEKILAEKSIVTLYVSAVERAKGKKVDPRKSKANEIIALAKVRFTVPQLAKAWSHDFSS